MKFSLLSVLLAGLLLPIVALGAYNDVSLTTGTTLRTTVGGSTIDLTVTSGTVQSVSVSNATLDVTLAAGSSIDLTSADKKVLSYSSGSRIASFECGSSSSMLNLSLGQGMSAETVTVTPSASTCVVQGTTGGGGSSSSSSSDSGSTTTVAATDTTSTTSSVSTTSTTPSTTTTTTATPSTTTTTVTAPVTTTTTTTAVPIITAVLVPALTSELDPGATSDDVTTLQTLLAKDATVYPEGIVSGYYGSKTTAAVKKFQAKYGLPTVGRVGPATMQKINEVLGSTSTAAPTSVQSQTTEQIQSQIQSIQNQIQALTSGSVAAGTITTELDPGATSDDVTTLQTLLAKDATVYPEGIVSGYYGSKTTAAVKKFQAKYGLPTVGRVGPATMAKINEVLGATTPVTPESPSSIVPQSTSATASMIDQITAQIQAIQDQIKALQAQ